MNGVLALMKGFYNDYEPTGAYSMEFRGADGNSVAEVFWAMPPEEYNVGEPQHASLTRTLSGGYLADHGAAHKRITLSGSLHFYTIMNPALPNVSNAVLAGSPEGLIDGLTEFYKIRYLLSRYRDYTMTVDGRLPPPSFTGQALASAAAVAAYVAERIETGKGALADSIELIWHAYDMDDHYAVKIDEFNAGQSKSDPNTIAYSISMMAYQVDKAKTGQVTLGKLSSREYRAPVEEQIQKSMNVLNQIGPQFKPAA